MKTHLQKLILSLLIAGLCVNCALPALAVENITESEKKSLEESVDASKKIFFQLYSQLWREHDLDQKLADAIDRGVDEKMSSMPWGTRGIQTMLRSKVAEEAQEIIINLFNPHYEKFIRDLEKRFGDENNKEVAIFYENLSDDAINQNEDPAIKAHLSKTTNKILKWNAWSLRSQIAKSLRKKHKGVHIKQDTIELDISTPDFTRQVGSFVLQVGAGVVFGATALSGAGLAAGSLVTVALPIAGAIASVWAGYKIGSFIFGAPEELKTKLYSALSENLTMQMPAYYWEIMESDIRLIFEEACVVFNQNLEKAIDSAVPPKVRAMIDRRLREEQ